MKRGILLTSVGILLMISGCSNAGKVSADNQRQNSGSKPDANGMYPDGTLAEGHSALQGHIVDTEGKPIAGAHVEVTGAGSIWRTNADKNGAYTFFLVPGSYSVTIAKDGYATDTFEQELHSKLWRAPTSTILTEAQAAESSGSSIQAATSPQDVPASGTGGATSQPIADASPSKVLPCGSGKPPQQTCTFKLVPISTKGTAARGDMAVSMIAGTGLTLGVRDFQVLAAGDNNIIYGGICVLNDGKSPVSFEPERVSVSNADGSPFGLVPKEVIASHPEAFSAMFGRNGYWGNEDVASGSHTCHYLLFSGAAQAITPISIRFQTVTATIQFVLYEETQSQTPEAGASLARSEPTSGGQSVAVLKSLVVDDVRDRCGEPDGVHEGVPTVLTYGRINLEFDVIDTYKDHPNADPRQQFFWQATMQHEGSNHLTAMGSDGLAKAMPCLLKGGIAQ